MRLGITILALVTACDEPPKPPAHSVVDASAPAASSAPPVSSARGSLLGARTVMEQLLEPNADRRALIKQLAPAPGDAAKVFTGAFASQADKHYQRASFTLAPDETETELLMWKVQSEELRDGTGDAVKCNPAYRKVGSALMPGLTWYCFRFVKPAEKSGTESEGLVFVNGRWVLFPSPWSIGP